jgi:tetratricopeptide (TPR) repeat protein
MKNNRPIMTLDQAVSILKNATVDLINKRKSSVDTTTIKQAIAVIELNVQSISNTGIKIDPSLLEDHNVLVEYITARDNFNKSKGIKITRPTSEAQIFARFLKKDKFIEKEDIKNLNKKIGERKNETVQATLNQAHKYFQDRLSKDDFKQAIKQKQQKLKQLKGKINPQREKELIEEIKSLKEEKLITVNSNYTQIGVKALERAFKTYEAVLKIAKNPSDKCEAYIGIGKCYHARGNLVEASKWYKKARKESEKYFDQYVKIWNKQAGQWNVKVDIKPSMPTVITMRKSSFPELSATESPPTGPTPAKSPPLPPITEKMAFIKDLKDYVNKYNKNFLGPWLKNTKIQSAEKLIDLLEHPSKKSQIDFKDKELIALSKGKLGDILKGRADKVATILPPSLLSKLRSEIEKDQYRVTSVKSRANRK